MPIKTKQIDCASKNIFKTWKLPTSAVDTSGDIYWSAVVYIQDTGEIWTHGKLYGGFFSNVDNNKVSLTIGGTERILSLDGHVQPYTTLTGSGTIANQAILSTGVENKWTLKTLGKNAFSNEDYLPIDATAEAAKKVINALKFQYNGIDMHSFDGSEARLLNIIQGDNVFITGDSQGNVTIAADPGSDTVNTAGATNKIDAKLFLIGAESQTTAPQTYSNQYVYVGTDNCLYSLGKRVLTDHQTIYNLDLQTLISGETTKVTTFDPNAANNSFTLVQGTNITLVPDAQNKRVTISSKDTTYNFYNLIFKQGETIIDTYKPTTSPDKIFKAGTNVTFSKNDDDIIITTQDTRNTAGTTEKANTKLFLVGAESQSANPQTYSNAKVYIGIDGKLYSDNKEVSTGDHVHNYAGAKTPGGPALKIDLNPDGLLDAEYGTYGGIIQDSNNGPISGSWSNRIKVLHNNSSGYYTELAQNFTGTAGVWHRRNVAGVISEWTPLLDKSNFHTYLDGTYIQKQTDPNQLKNFVRYSLESGLTINWAAGNVTPTQVIGFKENNSAQAYTFNGDNIRAFANAVNRSGDTMSGNLTTTGIILTTTTGITHNGKSSSLLYCDGTNSFVGMSEATTYIRSGNTDLFHKKNGTDYKIWDASNDGSNSGLDADLLDGTQLTNIVHYADSNAYDNTSCSRIIPISNVDLTEGAKYGSIFQWTNITTQTPAQTGTSSNWFNQLYGSTNDRLYFRTRTNGGNWTSWHKIAYVTDNVASATHADYPTGFKSKLGSASWGNQDGTFVTGWSGPDNADIQFRNNGGKINVIIDGVFYQNEGQYMVLDTNNYSSTLDGRYLLKGSAVNSNNNSSWLSFANNAGGVGGTMGVNDEWRVYGRATADNAGYLELATADDGNEPIYVRQYSGVFSTLKRTLTLLDGSGNTSMPGNLTVTNTTTSGNFNTSGRYTSTYASGTWISSVSNSALTLNISSSSYGGVWCAPTKGGRVTMSVYPSSNNNVYIGYASSEQIANGTNSFTKQTYWNADNGFWTSGGYVKEGSSDSYVLLGAGGHTTLSSLGGSHTHTVLKNNLMIKGTNGISDSASIHLGIGDSDTGFKWISDGVCQMYANNKAIGQWNSGGMNWYYTPQVNGVAVSLSNHTHTYIVSSGLRNATANGNTRGESGVRLYGCYNNSYPINYGAVLHLHEGRGAAELLLGWSGTDGAHAENYIRSKRDNDNGAWSGWAKIWTSANLDISTYFKYQGNNVNADWNGITTTGNMRVSNQTITNGPSGAYNYGQLLTFNAGGTLSQIYLPHQAAGSMYIRTGWSGVSQYYGWVQVLTTGNYTNLIGNSFIKKAGDTMTGALNFANNTWNRVGDDVYIGDHNQANYLCIKANSGTTVGINFFNSSDGDIGKLASVNGTLQWKGTNISLDSHTHGLLHNNFTTTIANTTTDSGWSMINGSYNGFILKSLRMQANAPSWVLGNYAAGICFGGADTKGVISVAYSSAQVRVAGGNGSKPVWSCNLWHDKNFTPSNYYDSTTSRTANTVLAAPNGSAGKATFRKLVAADIPALDYITTRGSYSQPIVLFAGWVYRSTKTSTTWYYTGAKVSAISSVTCTTSGGVLTMTLNRATGKYVYCYAVTANTSTSGDMPSASASYSGRSGGADWMGTYTNGATTVYIRHMRQADQNNDSWYSGNINEGDGPTRISVIGCGYCT